MAEVVDWSPVDDDNNSAPPVGAPEGMMPSGVNNTMRAMMGSLRRMYDKLVDGTQALPYLPTAGGTVTGNLAVNGTGGVSLSGVQLRNISNALEVYHAAAGFVSSRGAAAGYVYGDRDQVSATWTWYANGGLSYLHNTGTGNVLNVTNAGRMALAGAIDTPQHLISGTLFAQRSSDAHVIYDGGGEVALALYGPASGNINYYLADSHTFQTNAGVTILTIAAGTVTFPGNISTAGTISAAALAATNASVSNTVQANQLTSNLDIDAVRHIDAGGTITGAAIVGNTVHANTTLSAGTSVAAPTITASGNMSAANLSAASSISAGTWINAPQYRLAGVPIEFTALFDQIRDLQDRVAALESH